MDVDARGGRRQRAKRRRRFAALVVAASMLAGGLAGGLVARVVGPGTSSPGTAAGPADAGTAVPPTGAAGTGFDPLHTLPSVVAELSGSVVAIDATSTTIDFLGRTVTSEAAGTGFVFAEGGLIATNAHVVSRAETITVHVPGGGDLVATLVGADTVEDLAVLRVPRDDLVPLELAESHTVTVGEFVIVAGNALALEGYPTITVGIVSAVGRTIVMGDGSQLSDLIQTDAGISSGDSGGPLLTASGGVIGVNTAGAASSDTVTAENIGFAIPITTAAAVLRRLAGGTAG